MPEKMLEDRELAFRESHRLLKIWSKQLNHLDNGRRLVAYNLEDWVEQISQIYKRRGDQKHGKDSD